MSEFIKPQGINFSCEEEISADELSKVLCQIVSFVQKLEPYTKLKRYGDWWEHDGLHFYRSSISFDELFKLVNSSNSLWEAMSGDFNVFTGIAPENYSWYLRFYLDWDNGDENLIGRFDITFPREISDKFRREVLNNFDLKIAEQDAEKYYQSISA